MFLLMSHQSPPHLLLANLETCCLLLRQPYFSFPSKINFNLRNFQHDCYHSNMLLDLLTSTCSGALEVEVAVGIVAGAGAGTEAVAATAVAEERMVTNPAGRRCGVLFLFHPSGAIHCIHHLCSAGSLCSLLCLFLLL